ncbi:MAG: diguanylate cyclase, partial [Gammaproteobacteria bacterium]|nr:diguanylate cyclase [Gammaproteobacteria bacterium]
IAAVLFSSLLAYWLMPNIQWNLGMLIALFSMLMATDAITVTSVFHQFNLPERLKIYVEGESLLNDITALILFYFVALPLMGEGMAGVNGIDLVILKVLVLSVLVGSGVAGIGFLGLKLIHDPFEQVLIIYLVSILSFVVAEHLHVAGILSILASILTFQYLVDRESRSCNRAGAKQVDALVTDSQSYYSSILEVMRDIPAITGEELWAFKKEAYYIGLFANAVVFISIANLVHVEQILHYSEEVVIVFLITTGTRLLFSQGLLLIRDVPRRWSTVLTFSGMKGGLAIIMAHSIPTDFAYYSLFQGVVVGIVILSTFIYTLILMGYLTWQKRAFDNDRLDKEQLSIDQMTHTIQGAIEKDVLTGAYNPVVFEEILNSEIMRAQRYKLELSLIMVRFDEAKEAQSRPLLKCVSQLIQQQMREIDIFGRLSRNQVAVLVPSTALQGGLIFQERLERSIGKHCTEQGECTSIQIAVVELSEGDTTEMFIEHAETGLRVIKV